MEETMKNLLAPCLLALALSACATRPERIAAATVPQDPYVGSDCTQLASTLDTARADLKKYSAMQDTKANEDAASVFLVLIPASWFTGDHEKEVAKSKGEVAAIEVAQAKKGCKALRT
jgi:outer membrane PBP1 activator LpoA protein